MQNTGHSSQPLRRALNFTDEDLAANRQGKMTNSQLLHLIQRTTVFFVAISVGMIVFFVQAFRSDSSWQILGYYVVLFLVMIPWLGLVGRRVKVVEGKLVRYIKPSGDPREPATHHLKVKEIEFFVSEDIFNCFANGLTYRIFYTPIGKLVVAAERLDRQASSSEFAPAGDKNTINARLREALHFTEEDSVANQAGKMTFRQSRRIVMNSTGMDLLKATIPMIVFGGIGTMLFMDHHNMVQVISRIFLILGGVQLVYALVQMPWSDILPKTVHMVEGPVTMGKTCDDTLPEGVLLILQIQGITLAVPDHVFDCFENGRCYRIFHTRSSKKVVAAECLE